MENNSLDKSNSGREDSSHGLNLLEIQADKRPVDFEGSVSILPNFSGAIIRFKDSKDSDKAIVLTNGHAVVDQEIPVGQAISNLPNDRQFRIIPADGKSRSPGTIKSDRLLYATKSQTDIALYRLTDSYADLQSHFGINALTLASGPAGPGRDVSVVSGYWRYMYSCSIDAIVPKLQEGPEYYRNAIRYSSDCRMTGGVSGSPIVAKDTHEVVGIHNTSAGTGEDCSTNNPCELSEDGQKKSLPGRSYGQQVSEIYGCLDGDNNLDLSKDSCKMPKPAALDSLMP